MKKIFTIIATVLLTAGAYAQSPEKMSYQAVIRNSIDALVTNTQIGMEINIRQGTPTGAVVYTETQTPTTSANGLVSIRIGDGAGFSTIDWANGPYFIETKTAVVPPLTTYTITGNSELISVPFALYAKAAESITGTIAETDPVFGTSIASGINETDTSSWNNKLDSYAETQTLSDVMANNNSANNQIKNVTDPTEDQDAATKAYVDELKGIIYNELLDAGLNGIVRDADGNAYKTIKIGDQVWMAENLRTTQYNNGTPIPLVTDNTAWTNLSTPGYCWYNNDSATLAPTYGAIYNWHTVNTGELCPAGWHVPIDAEFTILTDYLGGLSVAGGKLKETGTIHWDEPNAEATNETGFTALPGGVRYGDGSYQHMNQIGYLWSATEVNSSNAAYWSLFYNTYNIFGGPILMKIGFSVRCLRD